MRSTGDAAALELAQSSALRRARRNASALLAAVGVAFLATFALPEATWTGYLRAALEAGLVGGLADWFAVVALFRHPLGVPIPHTAVIPRSKDGLGQNLASFVEGNFLSEDQVRERVGDPAHVERLATWLADRERADRVAWRAAVVLDATIDALDEAAIVDRAVEAVRDHLRDVPTARLAGQSLEAAIRDGRHGSMVSAVLAGVVGTMTRNRSALRARLGEQSPSWVPPLVDDLVFERAEQVVRTFLMQLAEDPTHELRIALDEQLLALTQRLQEDEEVQHRVDEMLQDVLTDELLRRWIGDAWARLRRALDAATVDDEAGAALRGTAVDAVTELGRRLRDDQRLHDRAQQLLAAVAAPITTIGQREVGGLIETTIERWDAEDTSRRLELWLGRDLQFVRINGTVVGALVGVVLHAVAAALG